ncbi:MAG TPA: IPT/TIG domain-containing protein [Candidatus Dormibacteraeota bacterium]|nr:IPT/TIG domain-containing protein [Candidatus Dormibacteraeota bacterium]
MRARICLPLLACSIAAVVVVAPMRAGATPASGCRPSISAVDPPVVASGDLVTVSGAGFGCDADAGGAPSVTVGGEPQTLAGAGDHVLEFHAGERAGAVQVSIQHRGCNRCPDPATSNDDHLVLVKPVVRGGTRSVPEGVDFAVDGRGLTFAGSLQRVSATACGERLGVRRVDDTRIGLVAPSTFCRGALSLVFTVFTDTERDATTAYTADAGHLETAAVVRGLSPVHAVPDQVVTLTGSGFGDSGSALLDGNPVPSTWFDTSIGITVQPGSVSGALTLVRDDGRRVDAGRLQVDSVVTGLSATRAQTGDTVSIAGGGFGPRGVVSLGGTRLPISRWSPTQIAVAIPAGAATGDLLVMPDENSASSAAAPVGLTIVGIDLVTPTHAAPGTPVRIIGHGLGSARPVVLVGTTSLLADSWDDHQVVVRVPDRVESTASVTLQVPGAATPLVVPLTIDPPRAARTAAETATVAPGAARAATARVPVAVVLRSARSSADPGQDVAFTVRLTGDGRALAGVPVDLVLVTVPGADAAVTPARGVTDVDGRVSGSIHLSRTAGDHVVLARSGQYSDETVLVARSVRRSGAIRVADSSTASGDLGGTRTVIVVALLSCLVLFLTGFGINLGTTFARRSARSQC